jgi:hypothetical protein
LSARLDEVRRQVGHVLDVVAPGPIRLLSMCAGQGRDVIDVLASHPRGRDVTARLVESDPANVAYATSRASEIGRTDIEMVRGDASTTDAYEGIVPADVLLVCGVFGNISEQDMARTISLLPSLSAPGAYVVWTRHRRPPNLTGYIRSTFEQSGFVEVAFAAPEDFVFTVGTQRLAREPDGYVRGHHLFTFVGDGALPA